MYELAKPSQLRAAPPLRDVGLPGVTPSFWVLLGSRARIRLRKTGRCSMPGAGKNTRCTASAFTHTFTMGHTYRISLLACATEAT